MKQKSKDLTDVFTAAREAWGAACSRSTNSIFWCWQSPGHHLTREFREFTRSLNCSMNLICALRPGPAWCSQWDVLGLQARSIRKPPSVGVKALVPLVARSSAAEPSTTSATPLMAATPVSSLKMVSGKCSGTWNNKQTTAVYGRVYGAAAHANDTTAILAESPPRFSDLLQHRGRIPFQGVLQPVPVLRITSTADERR